MPFLTHLHFKTSSCWGVAGESILLPTTRTYALGTSNVGGGLDFLEALVMPLLKELNIDMDVDMDYADPIWLSEPFPLMLSGPTNFPSLKRLRGFSHIGLTRIYQAFPFLADIYLAHAAWGEVLHHLINSVPRSHWAGLDT